MVTKLGFFSLLAGFFIGIFSGISKFMHAQNFWVNLTLSRVMGEETADQWIASIQNEKIIDLLEYFLYQLPLFGFLLGLGVFLLLISLFLKNH